MSPVKARVPPSPCKIRLNAFAACAREFKMEVVVAAMVLREEEKKGKSGSKLTLPQNRVAAGHSRKMRESKNLVSKSAADMAAIFGVKVEDYRPAGAAVGATGTTVSYSCSDTDPTRKKRSSGSKKKKKKKSRSKNDSLGEEVDNRLAEKKKKKRTKKGEKLKRED